MFAKNGSALRTAGALTLMSVALLLSSTTFAWKFVSPRGEMAKAKQSDHTLTERKRPLNWVVDATKDWMGALSDGLKLNHISIPGTFISAAMYNHMTGTQTQAWSITDQLKAGIRFLDLRTARTKDNIQDFSMYHNISFDFKNAWNSPRAEHMYMKRGLKHVLGEIRVFLNAHPKEVVIIRLKRDEIKPRGVSMGNEPLWDNYVYPYFRDYIWHGTGMPTLGEARGKIVILQDGFNKGGKGMSLNWNRNTNKKRDEGNGTWCKDYKILMRNIKAHLKKAPQIENDKLNMTTITAHCLTEKLKVRSFHDVAKATNTVVYNWLVSHAEKYTGEQIKVGVVNMTYPGESLIYKVISTNFKR